jgi:hypothetical protein
VSVATVNIGSTASAMAVGHAYTGSGAFFDGKVFELALCSAVPAGRSAIAADFMTHIGAV